jgi:ribosomal protein S18 acetylase RimI-like enzyme
MPIFQCKAEHLAAAADLFNQYRMFYEQPSDLDAATEFLQANVTENRSIVFLLQNDEGQVVAFAQLYPTYCSTAMQPYLYLSDLFVDPSVRKQGHARALMSYLIAHFKSLRFQRLTLETARTNTAAQRLYESLGYEKDQVFLTYHRTLQE